MTPPWTASLCCWIWKKTHCLYCSYCCRFLTAGADDLYLWTGNVTADSKKIHPLLLRRFRFQLVPLRHQNPTKKKKVVVHRTQPHHTLPMGCSRPLARHSHRHLLDLHQVRTAAQLL